MFKLLSFGAEPLKIIAGRELWVFNLWIELSCNLNFKLLHNFFSGQNETHFKLKFILNLFWDSESWALIWHFCHLISWISFLLVRWKFFIDKSFLLVMLIFFGLNYLSPLYIDRFQNTFHQILLYLNFLLIMGVISEDHS